MSQRKYEKLVYSFTPEYNGLFPTVRLRFCRFSQAYFRCQSDTRCKYNVGFQICKALLSRQGSPTAIAPTVPYFPWRHLPQCLTSMPTLNLLSARERMRNLHNRKYHIRVPAGVYHCPLNFIRVDKPVFFQAALMQPMFGGIYDTPKGPNEMYYNGPTICKIFPGKKCDSCRTCMEQAYQEEPWTK